MIGFFSLFSSCIHGRLRIIAAVIARRWYVTGVNGIPHDSAFDRSSIEYEIHAEYLEEGKQRYSWGVVSV